MQKYDDVRHSIDSIDHQIVELTAKRSEYVKQATKIKMSKQMKTIFDHMLFGGK